VSYVDYSTIARFDVDRMEHGHEKEVLFEAVTATPLCEEFLFRVRSYDCNRYS
jgi:hypothetical protein